MIRRCADRQALQSSPPYLVCLVGSSRRAAEIRVTKMAANQRGMVRRSADALGRCARAGRSVPAGLRRLFSLPADERWTTVHALTVLLVVEATIRWTRLPRLSRALGVGFDAQGSRSLGSAVSGSEFAGAPITTREAASEADLPEPVSRARRSVDRLMRIWPLGAGPCLRESLVLGHLIRDRDPVLRLGVARHGHRMRAHAWIELDGRPVNDPKGFVAFGDATE